MTNNLFVILSCYYSWFKLVLRNIYNPVAQTITDFVFFLLVQVFPYPNYTTNLAMNMVSLFMPLLVMLGLMYSAMTIIKVIQLQWNRFLVIIVLC